MKYKCCICGKPFDDHGNNPWPLSTNVDDICCDACNAYVIEARVYQASGVELTPDVINSILLRARNGEA